MKDKPGMGLENSLIGTGAKIAASASEAQKDVGDLESSGLPPLLLSLLDITAVESPRRVK